MFIYEREGKLQIMLVGGKPAAEGETPNISIEPVTVGDVTTAKILVDGVELGTASAGGEEEDEG